MNSRKILSCLVFTASLIVPNIAISADDQQRSAAISAITHMVHDQLPRSYSILSGKLRWKPDPEKLNVPVIRYTAIVNAMTTRLFKYLDQHREKFDLQDDSKKFAAVKDTARNKITYQHALNMIDNQSQLFFDLETSGGAISDCSSPAFQQHRRGFTFAICLDRLEADRASIKLLVAQDSHAEWLLEKEGDNWVLVDIISPINDQLVTYLIMLK